MPLGLRAYGWASVVFAFAMPLAVAILFATGNIVFAVVLLGVFVLDMAILFPLVMAKGQRWKQQARPDLKH